MSTIFDIAMRVPDRRPVLRAPGRRDLDGIGLRTAISRLRTSFPGGLDGRRVAIVGPDTAETALVLIAVASTATAAPLHPDYTEAEFEFQYGHLGVDTVLIHALASQSAVAAAARLGLPLARYEAPSEEAAGVCRIDADGSVSRVAPLRPRAGKAFVLHTSGTTGRPKIVPLQEDRIAITASNIAQRLRLDENDRALSIMPLFHVHGILNVLLPSLVAGASVSYGGRFDPVRVFDWLTDTNATWLSAVPTMHMAMLARARLEGRTAFPTLRFVRSSSAPLSPSTRTELERFYRVPVIESYGMTEIDQIASQELPPAASKAGSVGRSGGPAIRIVTEAGATAPAGVAGEVCVSGPNCFPGYEDNPEATRAAFIEGSFRTGDLGWLDRDGHLFLIGRVKEIISRGGEKIAPLEIDHVMGKHPGVAEAAAFTLSDPALGEEVGLAIVAREPRPTQADLLAHAAQRLAPFKLPAQIYFVDRLPRGPTGKLLRAALATTLGRARDLDHPEPETAALERCVAKVWSDVLGVQQIGRAESFTSLGGSSLSAAQVLTLLEKQLGCPIPLSLIVKASTIAEMARALADAGIRAAALAAGSPL